ncbi:MAG: FliH/SctL family protein [bacterium]
MPYVQSASFDSDDEIVIENVLKGAGPSGYVLRQNPLVFTADQVADSAGIVTLLGQSIDSVSSSQERPVISTPSVSKEVSKSNTVSMLMDPKILEKEREKQLLDLNAEMQQLREKKMAELEAEMAVITERARKEGFEAGKQEIDQKVADDVHALAAEVKKMFDSKQTFLASSEKGLLDLAVAIAERVIQVELSSNKEALQGILKEAIMRVTDKDHVLIRVNPELVDEVAVFKESFTKLFKDIKKLDVVQDSSLKVGGCIVETHLGFIDSSVSTKLDLIKKALYGLIGE